VAFSRNIPRQKDDLIATNGQFSHSYVIS